MNEKGISRLRKVGVMYIFLIIFMQTSSLTLGWIPDKIMDNFWQFFAILVPVIVLAFISKVDLKERFKFNGFKPRTLIYCVILTFAIYHVSFFLSNLTNTLFGYNPSGIAAYSESLQVSLFVRLFIMAITPAICEELMFRGLLLDRKIGVNMHILAILGGIMFAMFHIGYDQLLYTFPIGMVYTYVALITNSIFPSIIMHFLNNGLPTLLSMIFKDAPAAETVIETGKTAVETTAGSGLLSEFFSALIAILVITLAIRRLIKIYKYDDSKRVEENREDREIYRNESKLRTFRPQIIMFVLVVAFNLLMAI